MSLSWPTIELPVYTMFLAAKDSFSATSKIHGDQKIVVCICPRIAVSLICSVLSSIIGIEAVVVCLAYSRDLGTSFASRNFMEGAACLIADPSNLGGAVSIYLNE